jgi:subtilisin family serine protease
MLLLNSSGLKAQPRFVPGQILVKPRAGLSETDYVLKMRNHGARHRRTLRPINVRVVTVSEDKAESVLAALRHDPDIEFVERDYLARAAFVPNDPYVATGTEWHLSRIQAAQAWNFTAGRPDVVVAVLDSGINAAHPDLATQLSPGYDFVNDNNQPADDYGHGTAVSGAIAAAGNNGLGVAGVAYGARVLPVKVMNSSGFASYSCMAQGIKYAVDQGARVINISIVGSSPSATLQDAINYAWSNNVVIVAAAGNNADDTPQYPAACDHVVSVSATEPDDSLAWFSSYGGQLTLSAPGDTIWTAQNDLNNPYGAWRGTSFASPIAAGVAALVASENPSLANTQIVSILEQSADDLGPAGWDTAFGYGRVNAWRAVTAASLEPGALPPAWDPAPAVTLSSPADSAQFSLGTTVPVTANAAASTSGGAVTNVQFRVNGELLASLEAAPFAWDWAPARPGTYTLTAQAMDDQGLCATSSPVLVDVLTPGDPDTTPDVVPGQLRELKGGYAGLMANTNGVLPGNSGYFRLRVTASGRFTGRLFVAGKGYGFRGTIDPTGNAATIVHRGKLNPLALTLLVDLTNGTDQVVGSATDGGWISPLSGYRNVFDASTNPALQAGSRAFVLEQAPDLARAAATGISHISRSGKARVRGRLNDGRAFSAGSLLARNGDCPFYLSLSHGSEMVIGWLNFPAPPAPAANGTVLWVGNGANAFAATLQAAAAE